MTKVTRTLVVFCLLFGCLTLSLRLFAEDSVSGASGTDSVSNDSWSDSDFLSPDKLDEIINPYRTFTGTGKEFIISNPVFKNLKLISSEDIHIYLEALPKLEDGKVTDVGGMISIHIEPLSTTINTETVIILSGIDAFWKDKSEPIPLFLHQGGHMISELNPANENTISWNQGLKTRHHIYIQPIKGTLNLGVLGEPVETVDYRKVGSTYYLKRDILEQINIWADDVTLTGQDPDNPTVFHKIIGQNTGYGIYLYAPTGITIQYCTVQNFSYGIYFPYSSNINLNHNKLDSNTYGISSFQSSDNVLSDNTVTNAYTGIGLTQSNDNTLTHNTTELNFYGILLYLTLSNTLTSNNINTNLYGLTLWVASDNTIVENTINSNTGSGFYLGTGISLLYSSPNNTLLRNTISSNERGLIASAGSINNIIIHNNFIDNTIFQAGDASGGINIWDNGYLSGGNYWSDYNYALYDTDGDGIGNTPYCFTGGQDGFPVIKDFWDTHSPVIKNSTQLETNLEFPINVGTVTTTDLSNYESDLDDSGYADGKYLTWTIDGLSAYTTTYYTASISDDTLTIIATAEGNADLPLILTDSSGLTATTTVNITIIVPNNPPWILPVVPDIITDEDVLTAIDLTVYENDTEDGPAGDGNNLTWTITGVNPLYYTANINSITDVLTINPTPNTYGTFYAYLILSDSQGLTVTQQVGIVINSINDPPVIELIQPGMTYVPPREKYGKRQTSPPTTKIPISWTTSDIEGDVLEVSISCRAFYGPWFIIYTDTLNQGYYEWDTENIHDDLYIITVEARERFTTDHLTASARSIRFFLVDNKPISCMLNAPTPTPINPGWYWDDKVLLPFEITEPITYLRVDIMDLDATPQVVVDSIEYGPTLYLMGPGIHAAEWNGKMINGTPQPPHTYAFRLTYKDLEGVEEQTLWSDDPLEYGSPEYTFTINNQIPVFTGLNDTPDPFTPSVTPTEISYTVGSPDDVNTTLTVRDVTGTIIKTLVNNESRASGSYTEPPWDGAGITGNGIFEYVISGERNPPYHIPRAIDKSGVMRAIDWTDTKSTTSSDGRFIVYSQPVNSEILIVQDRYICPDATFTIEGVISAGSDAPLYPVSRFYDITPITPPAIDFPLVFSFKYDSHLPPENIKLFHYIPDPLTFIAVENYLVDETTKTLYAEVNSLSSFVLMASRDVTKPNINNLVLTHQALNFTLNDLSGINTGSIRVIIDGQDITNKLTVTGNTGDLSVTVSAQDIFQPWLDSHTLIIIAQDRAGNQVRRTETFSAGFTDVKVVIKPESLNINPGVLTVYAKFPETFGIPLVLNATLDGATQERWSVSYEDMEDLKAPIVVIKFRRQDIENALNQQGKVIDTEFVLSGTFDDGTALFGQLYGFEGYDSITKIVKEESQPTQTSEAQPSEQEPPTTQPPESPSDNKGQGNQKDKENQGNDENQKGKKDNK